MIKGTVQKIFVKPFNGVNLTSFSIRGQDGFYSLGDKPATFKEGDSLQFEAVPRGKYTYAQNIVPWTDGGTTTSAPVASVANAAGNSWQRPYKPQRGGFGGAGADKDEYWKRKEERDLAKEGEWAITQQRIEIQAARNAAIETAKFLWEKDLVPKPKKKVDEYDSFLALVDEVASKYLQNTSDRITVDKVGSATPAPDKAEDSPQPAVVGGDWE